MIASVQGIHVLLLVPLRSLLSVSVTSPLMDPLSLLCTLSLCMLTPCVIALSLVPGLNLQIPRDWVQSCILNLTFQHPSLEECSQLSSVSSRSSQNTNACFKNVFSSKDLVFISLGFWSLGIHFGSMTPASLSSLSQ